MESISNLGTHVVEKKESLEDKVDRVVGDVYKQIARDYGDYFGTNPNEIFWQNACQQFSEILREKLIREGISATYQSVDVKRLVPGSKPHWFVETSEYYIDGTWQQFIETPHNHNPYLLLNKSRIKEDLKELSVPEDLWFMYTKDSSKLVS